MQISLANPLRHDAGAATQMPSMPRVPRNLQECGLPFAFVAQLVSKIFFQAGPQRLGEIAGRCALPADLVSVVIDFLRREQLVEVTSASTSVNLVYSLTQNGRRQAEEYMRISRYAGPAPVPMAAYIAQVRQQEITDFAFTSTRVARAFCATIVAPRILEQLGAAMNSGRATLLHGPAGSGKTYLAGKLVGLLEGAVYVPHALFVDGQVIQQFDPLVHEPLGTEAPPESGFLLDSLVDPRWVLCKRPVVVAGGELSLEMLDLQFDEGVRYYCAPAQLKANNGLLIIDDLGRQLVQPKDLMNRWIVPLDRRIDYLKLHTGTKFLVPFDVTVIFCSNLTPSALGDEAFLRRLAYKIHIGALDDGQFRQLWDAVSVEYGVLCSDDCFAHVKDKFRASGRPLLACTPRDLLGQVRDRARYSDAKPEATPELIDWAWTNYFAGDVH